MMNIKIKIPHNELTAFCRRHHIRQLSLFGSVLREDFGPDSDIDVLVEFEPGARVGLIKFVGIQDELADILGREVDLVTRNALKPLIRDDILNSAEVIYAT
jgi:hypothetical protein